MRVVPTNMIYHWKIKETIELLLFGGKWEGVFSKSPRSFNKYGFLLETNNIQQFTRSTHCIRQALFVTKFVSRVFKWLLIGVR